MSKDAISLTFDSHRKVIALLFLFRILILLEDITQILLNSEDEEIT